MADALIKILAIMSPISAMLVAWLAFTRTKRKDDEEFKRNCHLVLGEIGRIKDDTSKIISAQERQQAVNMETRERLVLVESSSKQAHKRLDALAVQKRDG